MMQGLKQEQGQRHHPPGQVLILFIIVVLLVAQAYRCSLEERYLAGVVSTPGLQGGHGVSCLLHVTVKNMQQMAHARSTCTCMDACSSGGSNLMNGLAGAG